MKIDEDLGRQKRDVSELKHTVRARAVAYQPYVVAQPSIRRPARRDEGRPAS